MPRVARKGNPDFQKTQITSKDGIKMSVYKKIKSTDESGGKRKRKPRAPKQQKGANAQYTAPTDQNKPITNPLQGVAQSATALKIDIMEGLSQKEIDRMSRVKARVAQVKASQK